MAAGVQPQAPTELKAGLRMSPLTRLLRGDDRKETRRRCRTTDCHPGLEPGAIPQPARDAVIQRGGCGRAPFHPRCPSPVGPCLRHLAARARTRYRGRDDSLRKATTVTAPQAITPAPDPGSSHRLGRCLLLGPGCRLLRGSSGVTTEGRSEDGAAPQTVAPASEPGSSYKHGPSLWHLADAKPVRARDDDRQGRQVPCRPDRPQPSRAAKRTASSAARMRARALLRVS